MDKHQIRKYLEYYRDLGIDPIYKRQATVRPSGGPNANAAADAVKDQPPLENESRASAPSDRTGRGPRHQKEEELGGLGRDAQVRCAGAPQESESRLNTAVMGPLAKPLVGLPGLAPEGDSLESIRNDIGDCRRCRLCEARKNIVFGSGNEHSKLVFVGEGPGADEDEQGLPFVGRAGQLLTQMIDNTAAREGIPIRRNDLYICNVVKCRPPENRTPQPDEMEICGQFLFRQLNAIKPKAICALGGTAMKALLNTKDGITRLRGQWQKWNGIPLMITYHPSYLLRQYNQQAKREAWEDLKALLHFVYD